MRKLFDSMQPAVKKETQNVAVSTVIGTVVMWGICAVLHGIIPDKVPFDYTVMLAGAGGAVVAILNFFLMGLTVQKAAKETDVDAARARIKASYTQRMLLQVLWAIVAIVLPCFWFVAGLIPLLFPGMGIKIRGLFQKKQKEKSQSE